MSDSTSFINDDNSLERVPSPSVRTWVKHLIFFFLTICTATVASNIEPFGSNKIFPENLVLDTWEETFNFILSIPYYYVLNIFKTISLIFTDSEYLRYGLKFSLSMIFILTCHEMGHYIACRIYKVDATLPFFIPTPPLIGPAGTLGAFIQIRSPLPSRKATFDIGVAGPIAGFLALIPISLIGILTMETAPASLIVNSNNGGGFYFSDSIYTQLLASLAGINLSLPINPNPFYFAAWIGLLVTALNLIPSGQLDGGHAVYAIFGKRIHSLLGKIAFAAMAGISIAGIYFYGSPSGILFTIVLGIMLRVGHPEPLDETPLDFKRKVVAFLTLVIFILCFTPFPIQIR
jgi:membrane-associated protease RseP (regulator of RpoE activity)